MLNIQNAFVMYWKSIITVFTYSYLQADVNIQAFLVVDAVVWDSFIQPSILKQLFYCW